MTKATELREMSDEQLALTLKETAEPCFACGSRRRPNGSTRPASCASSGG